MHLRAHRPALAADVRRRYRRLDALAVLTEGDRADYAPLVDRVEVMPNPGRACRAAARTPTRRWWWPRAG